MRYAIAQESRKGGRRYNQDRLGHARTAEALLLTLADGMGGYAGGELAAEIAVSAMAQAFQAAARPRLADPAVFLPQAIAAAHASVVREATRAKLAEARTTLVACVVQDARAHWSFVGDSRLYLMRAAQIVARTRDHTYVQQLVDAGRMREEAVAAHPERNKLLRCLGGAATPQPERVAAAELARDDVVLLCSDGLWGPLTPRLVVMGFIGKAPARALSELTALAEARAGAECDNVSAVAMHWLA